VDDFLYLLWERLFSIGTYSSADDWLVRLAAAVLVGFLAWLTKRFVQWIAPRIAILVKYAWQVQRALSAVAPESRGIWLADSIRPKQPREYRRWLEASVPIIVVANLKGGVGKTTTATNLAAHYAIKKGKRVLIIDLDFQGSCSSSCLSRANRERLLEEQAEGNPSKAASLIEGKDSAWLRSATEDVDGVQKARIIPAYYSLASMENRVMVEWLLGKRDYDIRYHLAEVLHSESVQRGYDLIIVDAPPRLTTACVQALCAATHVLIPTVLDELSAEAVAAFADQLRVGQELWPHLRIVGVLGTMTERNTVVDGKLRETPLNGYENDAHILARDLLSRALRTANKPLSDATVLPMECFTPDKSVLGRAAGRGVAYADPGNSQALIEVREAFDRLGAELDKRIAESRA
jgi:chromosome partitioning protein